MPSKLDGVGVVVTGAASGIGKATATALADEGAGVVLFDINASGVDAAAGEIGERGGAAIAVSGDVTSAGDLRRAVVAAREAFGRLGAMMNFAGIIDAVAPCSETTEDLWDRVLAINLKGVFLGTRCAIAEMTAAEGGAIVNMASYAAFRAGGGGAAYAASKAGIVGLTRQVSSEVAPKIRVNAIAPGLVFTDLFATSADLLGAAEPNSPAVRAAQEQIRGVPVERIPVGRGADPEEIARVAVFLAGADSSYITGQTILIDGGASIRNA
jgi:3-oxoacyl-[acyl-carrier protein] reductase